MLVCGDMQERLRVDDFLKTPYISARIELTACPPDARLEISNKLEYAYEVQRVT
jgi:hypothetical protein